MLIYFNSKALKIIKRILVLKIKFLGNSSPMRIPLKKSLMRI